MTLSADLIGDLTTFIDDDEFAVAVQYTPECFSHPGTKTRTINVLFDETFVNIDGVESKNPIATGRAADFADVTHDAKMTVNDTLYRVRGIERDGIGLIALVLEKQSCGHA
jgi:hypothetical protein